MNNTCCTICLGWNWGWTLGCCCCWMGRWIEICCGFACGAMPTRLSVRCIDCGPIDKSVEIEGRLVIWLIDGATCSRFAWLNPATDEYCCGNCCCGFTDSCVTNYNKMLTIATNVNKKQMLDQMSFEIWLIWDSMMIQGSNHWNLWIVDIRLI